jgi:preprotein translocase subunit YajC
MFQLLAATSSQPANPLGTLVFIVPMFAIGYLLLVRPQKRRLQAQRELLNALEVGDEVVTAGGILGQIVDIEEDDDVVTVEIAPGTRIRMLRGGISRRLEDEDEDEDEVDDADDEDEAEEADRSS